MLGFGELLAHEAAFRLGWSGTKVRALVLEAVYCYSGLLRIVFSLMAYVYDSVPVRITR